LIKIDVRLAGLQNPDDLGHCSKLMSIRR